MIRNLPRLRSLHLVAKRHSSLPVSFIPTGSIHDFESELLSKQENESAIPDPPEFSNSKKLYSDIVRPTDVCDLVLRPAFEDVVVTSLATNCPLSGKDSYSVVSASSITSTKLLFANLAASWLDQLNLDILDLSSLPLSEHGLKYNNSAKSKLIANQYSPQVVESYENLENFYKFFIDYPDNTITIENVTQQILSECGAAHYKLIIQYLTRNVHSLNPFAINDFVAILLDDLVSSASVEKVELFDSFLNESLVVSVPLLLEDLPPSTLDCLAYITASSSDLYTARKTLMLLCRNYRIAPAKATFDLYMARYSKLAIQQEFTKDQILRDLSLLKPIIFHYGLTPNSFKLILTLVVDNTYDLSHLVKLVKETSGHLLGAHSLEILNKLRDIQESTTDSTMVKAVQATNLAREIVSFGSPSPQVQMEVTRFLSEFGVHTASSQAI